MCPRYEGKPSTNSFGDLVSLLMFGRLDTERRRLVTPRLMGRRAARRLHSYVSVAGTGGANVVRPRPLPSPSRRICGDSLAIRVRIQATLDQKLGLPTIGLRQRCYGLTGNAFVRVMRQGH